MGLTYDSGDSNALKSALAANLTTATAVLDKVDGASNRLVAALGTGELSGKGYAAVDGLFAQIVKPAVAKAKQEIASISGELAKYTAEDSKVTHYGVLKEDQLQKQLVATKKQLDATEHQIEVNTRAANSSTALPGLCNALEAKNLQLQLVCDQLEKDRRDLEDRLKALQDFAANTAVLFGESLVKLTTAIGGTLSLLDSLVKPFTGGLPNVIGVPGTALGAAVARQKILDYLAGGKLTVDSEGRVRSGTKYLFDTSDAFIFRRGKGFNSATGIRIDHYRQPLTATVKGLAAPIDDFNWKGASNWGKFGKGLGAAGTLLTVGLDVNEHFGKGGDGDARKFAVDVGVDLAATAGAAAAGAFAGSFVLPPIGTVVGAAVGALVSVGTSVPVVNGKSLVDLAKDGLKNLFGL